MLELSVGGAQPSYHGTTLWKPFFFLLVDSVLESIFGAADWLADWELSVEVLGAVALAAD